MIYDKCDWFDRLPFIYNASSTKKWPTNQSTFVMNQLLVKGNKHTGYLCYVEFAWLSNCDV